VLGKLSLLKKILTKNWCTSWWK